MLNQSDSNLSKTLLSGGPSNKTTIKTIIINATFDFVLNTKRFNVPLF